MEENMDDVKPFIYPGDDGSKLKPGSRYENFIGCLLYTSDAADE